MNADALKVLLRSVPRESEWVEFKLANDDPKTIGEYVSALSNSAALLGKEGAYLVWGIDDATGAVVAAVGVSGPIERLTRAPGKRYAAAVTDAARRIEQARRGG